MIDLTNPKIKTFVDHVKKECRKKGIKFDLRPSKYVKLSESMQCSGWFDSENMALVVAAKNSLALDVLVHEYGHFTQWDEDIPVWNAAEESLGYVEWWLAGYEVKNIKKWLALSRDLELDNEKRSVALIKKFNLPIDTKEYTKKANAYVQFYNWMYYSRRWSTPKNSPYRNNVILDAMPKKFNMNYKKLSYKAYKAFEASEI
jgi:hypothetical protein